MRATCWSRAAAICGALALACSVETEGAPCGLAGDTTQCPSGQACGNDLRCSVRALECEATRCDPLDVTCRDGDGKECTNADPICGTWVVLPALECTKVGLWCQGATPRCDCPAAGPTFEVDGTNVNPSDETFGSVTPTGASTNDACRFATLGAALAAAGTYAAQNPGVATTVRAMVDPEGGFSPSAGETLPILVPPGVTLESEERTSPTGSVITTDATVTTAIVRLDAGATIAGFTLRNQRSVPDATSSGFGVECDAGGTISNVAVETNNLAYGVRVTGAAPASLLRVEVDGPRRAGIWIETAAGAVTDIQGGRFTATALATDTGGGHGIWVRGGSVSIRSEEEVAFSALDGEFTGGTPAEMSSSTGSGVRAEKGTTGSPIELSIERVRVAHNGAAGIHVFNVPAGTPIVLTNSLVDSNGPTSYASRIGGGLVVSNPPLNVPVLTVRGSRIWSNTGDQIGLSVPDVAGAYDVSGGSSCGAESNVVGSCDLATQDVFSTTDTVNVPAQRNYWSVNGPRVTNADFDPPCAWSPPSCSAGP